LYSRLRMAVALLLCVVVLHASALADAAPTLGLVLQAEHARLGQSAASSGATLFDGDRLVTGAGGSIRARVNSSQLFLLAESSAAVRHSGEGASVALDRGTAIFSSVSPAALELVAASAQVRAHGAQPTIGQVTLVGANEFIVTCEKGELEVTVGGDVRTVAENASYRAVVGDTEQSLENGGPQSPQGAGTPQTTHTRGGGSRNHLILWILIGAAVGGTTYGVWRALHRVSDP
jgi:ferric-dicitrate binding protein FerR (iron transport regulator)